MYSPFKKNVILKIFTKMEVKKRGKALPYHAYKGCFF